MAAVWSIINDALAMLKEPGSEMKMTNVGLMGLRVDWGTAGSTMIQLGVTKAQYTYWPDFDVHMENITVVVKKRDLVFVTKRKKKWRTVDIEREGASRKRAVSFQSCHGRYCTSFHHEPKLSADAYQTGKRQHRQFCLLGMCAIIQHTFFIPINSN